MNDHTVTVADRLSNIHISAESYLMYKEMREWLAEREVDHKWHWHTTGRYFPDYVTIKDPESALAFKLTYNV